MFFWSAYCSERKWGVFRPKSPLFRSAGTDAVHFLFGLLSFFAAVFYFWRTFPVQKYAEVARRYAAPAEDSAFYRSEYVAPREGAVTFPARKKNLIVILMESMESSFADRGSGGLMERNLIPGLTRLADENVSFSGTDRLGGGIDLAGTGWTIAAMTAKFAGLPFNLLGKANQRRLMFLPNAVTLTDILSQNGYRQLMMFGSDKRFAGRDTLLETHGNVEIHDVAWYKESGMLEKDYSVFWGFEDKKLFGFARTELDDLGRDGGPFMLGILTVDTHMPSGYRCDVCPETEDMQLKNAVRCADAQVSAFIGWCAGQPWYKDTVIAVMGDHRFMANETTNPFGDSRYLAPGAENPRRWLDIFVNAEPAGTFSAADAKNRLFSSLDMFPTILAAMGCSIDGNRLGFGVNLFSGERTLCEKYGEDYLNAELMRRNRQYAALERPGKG